MGLQLKNSENSNVANNKSADSNPWDVRPKTDLENKYDEPVVIKSAKIPEERTTVAPNATNYVKIVILLLIAAGLLLIIGKVIVSIIYPKGTDETALLRKSDKEIASTIGFELTDQPAIASSIVQYSKNGVLTAKGMSEGVSVIYMDGKQFGVFINEKHYTMYGIQVGMGEKEVHDNMTYQYENFIEILGADNNKNRIYIYYNQANNDCVEITYNSTTNRVLTVTYMYDFKKICEEMDTF
ncbi:MAG: hypothetical protein ACI4F4_03690 [Lachnospiraceae bacterium]